MGKGIAYTLRAYLYEKAGKNTEAIFDYSKALVVNPDDKEAWVRRQRLLIALYVEYTKEGAAAFSSGVAAYKSKDDALAVKNLDSAALLFAQAASFNTGDKNAFGLACATKALEFQITTREILDKMQSASSDKESKGQLVSAYYTLAVTNAYYKTAIPLIKNEKLKNSVKEQINYIANALKEIKK
jgi:tetratricopeptide (TPR) repeat protein